MLEKILPEDNLKRKWTSIIITLIISGLLTVWGIYGIGQYGIALFILVPLLIGAAPAILYGHKIRLTKGKAWNLAGLTLAIFTGGLLAFAIEGLICIVMAAPLGLLLTWIGSLIGYSISHTRPNNSTTALLILIAAIPSIAFIEEKKNQPELIAVTTSIIINATPEAVWRNVVEFPQLKEPTELIFKTGIAYPINARIEGQGVGAIRYCNFSTGSFIEPISTWDEPRLLKFNVVDYPSPMKEISFWDIDAPHLHDYFVSKRGQFKLSQIGKNKTLLEGTTWYYHRISPNLYWRIWSNYIIHSIHERVLGHIKRTTEKK
jgi:hypothetical protein